MARINLLGSDGDRTLLTHIYGLPETAVWASDDLCASGQTNAIEEIREKADVVGLSCEEGGMSMAADWLNARLLEPREERLGGVRNG